MSFLSKIFGPSVPKITVSELHDKLKFGRHPLVLDVRHPDEFRTGHIHGAKLIPLDNLHLRIDELPKGREIVCVCASGNRSGTASRMLARKGYKALNVSGGMLAWRRAKLPMQK